MLLDEIVSIKQEALAQQRKRKEKKEAAAANSKL
jgi:hypothetical protein